MKTMIFTHKGGEVKVETKGYQGAACQAATKPYEQALGIVTEDKPTAEMYETPTVSTDQQLQQGSG